MKPAPGRLRSVAVLGGGTLLAALFGLLFQALLSYHFGAGAETDAWFMSLSIYAFLGKFLMLTNVKSLALPVYRRLQAAEPAAAVRLERRLLLWLGCGTGILSALIVVAAPLLVDALAPGYEGAQRDLTVTLVRIRTPALAFLAMSTGGLVALEAAYRFGVTVSAQKVAPAAVSLLLFALVADRFGMVGVGWAGLAGGVAGGLVAMVAMASLLRTGDTPVTEDGRRQADRELKAIGGQWLRFSGSNAATFVGEWAFRISASLLPVGLFSAVLYGRMIHDLAHAAVNDSAQTVSLPRFAAAAAEAGAPHAAGDRVLVPDVPPDGHEVAERVGRPLREGLGALTAVTLPVAAFMAVTAPWTVALLFGRGRFLEDGMLGPAALSLRIFALAFLVQGVNQLLFSAAFASGRSALVNRVQIAGHLTRAAVLVPAVMAFSYVGLVGAQVAMNVLVLILLLWFSPRGWALRPRAVAGTVAGRGGWGAVAAVGLTALVYVAVAARLPAPLEVGTVGRVGVLGLGGLGWVAVYGALAWLLGVPAVRSAVARLRRRGTLLVVMAAVVGAAPLQGSAQEVGGALLPADHWSKGVLQILEARGQVAAGASTRGPLSGPEVEAVLSGASVPWAAEALRHFRWEVGATGPGSVAAMVQGGTTAAKGGSDQGAFAGGWMRLGGGYDRVFANFAARGGPGGGPHALVRGGVGSRLGPFALQLGREEVQLGGGATGGLVLSAGVPLDGILLTTPERFQAGFLGPVALTFGAFPLARYQTVDDPWFALLRVAVHPTSWLQVGLSRAALVGGSFSGGKVPWDPVTYGPDTGSLSPGDVVSILAGRVTGYDNQVGALDVRASLASVGVPALVYGEVGLDDKDRSWGDAAVLMGALVAPWEGRPVAFRYEYAAFGDPARWCAWCDTLPTYWYQHTRFQAGWQVDGEVLGHPLGGYGLQHAVGVSAFDPRLRFQLEVLGGRLRRDAWNLLEDERPGWASWAGGKLRYRASTGTEFAVEGRGEWGSAGWSAGRIRISVAQLVGP